MSAFVYTLFAGIYSSYLYLSLSVLFAFLVLFLAFVFSRVFLPDIIEFPYPETLASLNSGSICCLAGSFNPPHKGHLQMLKYLSGQHGTVYAVVGFNPRKKYSVSPQVRLAMLGKMLSDEGLKNVKPVLVSGLIWKWCIKSSVSVMYRGIRSWAEDGKDETHLHFQNTFFPLILGPLAIPVRTKFLEGDPKYNHISSSLVRKLCSDASRKDNIENSLKELVGKSLVGEVVKNYSR